MSLPNRTLANYQAIRVTSSTFADAFRRKRRAASIGKRRETKRAEIAQCPRGFKGMGFVVSKRRPRSLLLIIPSPAEGIPPHDGTDGAKKPRRKCGRPMAGAELEGRACTQAKGWGE